MIKSEQGSRVESDRINADQAAGPAKRESSAENGAMSVKSLASKAADKLVSSAEDQKQAGIDYMEGISSSVRRAAGEFEQQLPEAARYIRLAADEMTTMSESLRRRDIGKLLHDVQSFARRQPTAFLGISLVFGFAATRFLRSSAENRGMEGNRSAMADTQGLERSKMPW